VWAVELALLAACVTSAPQSDRDFLADAWNQYRRAYVHADGYVLDRTRNGGEVTSEGQAYALLRAAWSDDRATFERVLSWTDTHLRRADGLLSWRWAADGGGRVLDANSATDADQDLAFALIVAAFRFERPDYLRLATHTVRAIRTVARVEVPGGWFPSAGNWATADRVVNLSYFTPYAYAYFDALDPEGRWNDVTAAGYDLLGAALVSPRRLPPDFMTVARDGALSAPADPALGRTFSFDAVRTYWRVALDCRLHARERACRYPGLDGLVEILRRDGRLVTEYALDGTRLADGESLTFYACVLPMLEPRVPDLAAILRRTRLSPSVLRSILGRRDRYFDLNWIWFGLALADGVIPERTPTVDDIVALRQPT
jgi:endo-1,4-beta-D-glucanase Y